MESVDIQSVEFPVKTSRFELQMSRSKIGRCNRVSPHVENVFLCDIHDKFHILCKSFSSAVLKTDILSGISLFGRAKTILFRMEYHV